MREKLFGRLVAGIVGAFLALTLALVFSVIERYVFGTRNIALALGYLGLLDFCERLYGVALHYWH